MAELIISPELIFKVIGKTYYTHLRFFLNLVAEKIGIKEKLFLAHFDIKQGNAIATTKDDYSISKSIDYKDLKDYELKSIENEINDDPEKVKAVIMLISDMVEMLNKKLAKQEWSDDYFVTIVKDKEKIGEIYDIKELLKQIMAEDLWPDDYYLTIVKDEDVVKGKKNILYNFFEVENRGNRGGLDEFVILLITEKPSKKKVKKLEKAAELIKDLFLSNYFKIFKTEGSKYYKPEEKFIKEFIKNKFKGQTTVLGEEEIIKKFYGINS